MPQVFVNGLEDVDMEVTPNQDKDLGYNYPVGNGDSGSKIWNEAPKPQMFDLGMVQDVDSTYVNNGPSVDPTDDPNEGTHYGQPDDHGTPDDFLSKNGEKGYYSLTKGTTDGAVN